MARAAKNIEKEIPIKRPATRSEKLVVIRDIFATQPLGGWDASEQNDYLRRIGLEPTSKSKPRSDEEIDFIVADLEKAGMILFK